MSKLIFEWPESQDCMECKHSAMLIQADNDNILHPSCVCTQDIIPAEKKKECPTKEDMIP